MEYLIKFADSSGKALDFEDEADNLKRAKLRAQGGINKGGAAKASVYEDDELVLTCRPKNGKAVCFKPKAGRSEPRSEPIPSSTTRENYVVPALLAGGALLLLLSSK